MNELFASIKQGLQEAVKFAEGDISQAQVFKAPPVDVKIIRSAVRMTQEEFAATFGISLGTLRHWERGDRSPRGPALVLLNLIQKDPAAILKVLSQ
ncbi:MAG: helix-turn-helix domain-containing protein [Caldilineaceae bacterium]